MKPAQAEIQNPEREREREAVSRGHEVVMERSIEDSAVKC
jgi:hypothetical protein